MWLDIRKPTIMSHLANYILLAQLIANWPSSCTIHALSMHCCIIGLSWLVCFSRAGFANRVKSRLRQWDPWRALDGRYGSDIHPCIGGTSLKASSLVWAYDWHFLDSQLLQTVQLEDITCLRLPTHPLTPYMCNPWYYSGCEKSCSKSSGVSYFSYYR